MRAVSAVATRVAPGRVASASAQTCSTCSGCVVTKRVEFPWRLTNASCRSGTQPTGGPCAGHGAGTNGCRKGQSCRRRRLQHHGVGVGLREAGEHLGGEGAASGRIVAEHDHYRIRQGRRPGHGAAAKSGNQGGKAHGVGFEGLFL